MSKIYTRDDINTILHSSDRAVERAMVRLFELQTAGEQRVAHTTHQNDEGFCAADAKAGTRFARWIQGFNDRNQKKFAAKSLTHARANRIFGRYCRAGEAPIDRARRIALKHSKQLVNIANAAAAAPDLNLSKEETGVKPALKPMQSDVWYQNEPPKPRGPQPGTWAYTAKIMAQGDDSGFDWDAWKDEMKDRGSL